MRLALLILLLVGSSLHAAVADEGDVAMARMITSCPGAAKVILEGHPDLASWEAAKHAAMQSQHVAASPPALPALRDELLQMSSDDQAVRLGDLSAKDVFARMAAVDARNLPRIKRIVDEHGFPSEAMVGRGGFNAAWLLVQHADADPAFQQRVLESLTSNRLIAGEQLAMLTDRVLRAQGKPQRYGSQFTREGDRWVPQPIEEPVAEVDERRASLGMMPLADYACTLQAMYATHAAD